MKFPDRPIATAGLGIACALVLLAILSWPTLVPQNAPTFNTVSTNAVAQSSAVAMSGASSPASAPVATSSTTRPPSINAASGTALSSTGGGTQQGIESGTTGENQTLAETTVASGTTVFTQAANSASSASSPENALMANSSFSSNHSNVWGSVALLSIVSLGIALVSAFYIHRRVNSEE